jgi:MYXO-CTERM domain-containing protein
MGMRAARTIVVVVVACALSVGLPARAEWLESPAMANPEFSEKNLKAVAVAKNNEGLVYAVGGSAGSSFMIKSTDGFKTYDETVEITDHGAGDMLNAVWVSASGDIVHAFGAANARASWNGTTWESSDIFTDFAPLKININTISFVDEDSGFPSYLAGDTNTNYAFLASWDGNTVSEIDILPNGFAFTASFFFGEQYGYIADKLDLFRQTPLNGWEQIQGIAVNNAASISFSGQDGIMVGGGAAAYVLLIDDTIPSFSEVNSANAPGFGNLNGVVLTDAGFAVAVGGGLGAGNKISESQDNGVTWADKASSEWTTLRSVACWNANHCVAVGDSAEILYYENHAPVATINAPASILEGGPIGPSVEVTDQEGDHWTVNWKSPDAIAGNDSTTPSLTAPPSVCGSYNIDLKVAASDGRLTSADATKTVAVTSPPATLEASFTRRELSALNPSTTLYLTTNIKPDCEPKYSWSCTCEGDCTAIEGKAATTGADSRSIDFTYSPAVGKLCGTATLYCSITVQSENGQLSATVDDVAVSFVTSPPNSAALEVTFSEGQSGDVLEPGQSVNVTVQARRCKDDVFKYVWDCSGIGVASQPGADSTSIRFAYPETAVCEAGGEGRCTVSAHLASDDLVATPSETFFVSLDVAKVELVPEVVDGDIPLDCEALNALRFVPSPPITVCQDHVVWTQQTSLPLGELTQIGDEGDLQIPLAQKSFGELIGRPLELDLTLTLGGVEITQTHKARLVPIPFVRLEHRADRPIASPGEQVDLSVVMENQCRSSIGGVDLHLSLTDLEFLPGSARLGNVALPDPSIEDGELVFRAIPLPIQGEAPPVLSYSARRAVVAARGALSSAKAFLTAEPALLVSREAEAGASGSSALAGISCQCRAGDGSGAGIWLWAVLGLAFVRRRTSWSS